MVVTVGHYYAGEVSRVLLKTLTNSLKVHRILNGKDLIGELSIQYITYDIDLPQNSTNVTKCQWQIHILVSGFQFFSMDLQQSI